MTIPLDVLRRILAGADKIALHSMAGNRDDFIIEIDGVRATVSNSRSPSREYDVTLEELRGE